MGEYVEGKDFNATNKLYNKVHVEEFLICTYLNQNMPIKMKRMGIFFEMQTKNQYLHHDLELVQISSKRKKTFIARVEYEYGAYQKEWGLEFPTNWDGINLLTRKDYDKNIDLFIKSSPNYLSIFAVDCSDDFVDKHFHYAIDTNPSQIDFVTNEQKYEIKWHEVQKHKFSFDDNTKEVENKNICVFENDPRWKLFYKFLWFKYFNK